MTGVATDSTPDRFATQFERREDGSLMPRPERELPPYAPRLADSLEHWARVVPERVLVARRGVDGAWRTVSYGQMLAQAQRIAAGLLTRKFLPDRPIVILSGNSIEHFTLGLAAMWAGIPYCPVSSAYSLVAGELARLRYVMELLTPGLVAAFDTPRFARALSCVPSNVEIVGDAPLPDRPVSTLDALARDDAARVAQAHAATRCGFDREIPAGRPDPPHPQGGDHHQPHVRKQCHDALPVHAFHHARTPRSARLAAVEPYLRRQPRTWAWC